VFERAKIVHALDRAANVIDITTLVEVFNIPGTSDLTSVDRYGYTITETDTNMAASI
jgi:hypothetical protein